MPHDFGEAFDLPSRIGTNRDIGPEIDGTLLVADREQIDRLLEGLRSRRQDSPGISMPPHRPPKFRPDPPGDTTAISDRGGESTPDTPAPDDGADDGDEDPRDRGEDGLDGRIDHDRPFGFRYRLRFGFGTFTAFCAPSVHWLPGGFLRIFPYSFLNRMHYGFGYYSGYGFAGSCARSHNSFAPRVTHERSYSACAVVTVDTRGEPEERFTVELPADVYQARRVYTVTELALAMRSAFQRGSDFVLIDTLGQQHILDANMGGRVQVDACRGG